MLPNEDLPIAVDTVKPDLSDGLVVVGLALVGIGVGMWSVPAALVTVGAIVLVIGLVSAIPKGAGGGGD